ncbi:hypothetical protein HUA74_24240 [Myxococcus sp. CA051A]|uniref:hypothetical protein n=1 Tax=unclassified Myxococcus TaxID=2648731 RepID=UPI00157ADA5B|nr:MULTISPECIES: hypothetical protein [unclassified Myxococcus]NTX36043.1 hypothetical protein [Myxococcus sp. CA033]NTX54317.1 hypothetical protein [Myxococcus sp. CA039A]NTX63772.1 hypothetical protein [Myxococcus sp. CA051A]
MTLFEKLLQEPSLHAHAGSAAKRASLKAKLSPSAEVKQVATDLRISEGQDQLLDAKSVTVKGNLIIEDQGRLLVAGDLVVEGNIIHEGFDYSLLFVGGSLKANNLLFHGEIVVLGDFALQGVAWTYYSDYSAYADTLSARLVVSDDREDAIDKVRAPQHLVGHSSEIGPKLGKLLHKGLVDEEGEWSYTTLAKKLLKKEELLP